MPTTSRTHLRAAPAAALALVAALTVQPQAQADSDGSTPGNLLANASFEEIGDDGLPQRWSPLWSTSAQAFEVVDTDASDGEHSLHVLDDDPEAGYGLRPDAVPVEGGQDYEFSFDLNFDHGELQPTVYFLDADGERLSQPNRTVTPGNYGEWVRESITVTAPPGAESAEPLLYSSITGTVDGLIDNVAFVQVEPEPEPDPPAGTEEDLGQPIGGITTAGAGYTVDADGRPIGLVIGTGNPSLFSAVDILTGERLMSAELGQVAMSWAYQTVADRSVYIGTQTGGQVWRFDPDELELTLVGERPLGQTHLWASTEDQDGRVLWGTYPDGKIIAYDPAAGEWHDEGVQVEGNDYVRSIAADGPYVYAGGGSARPSVSRLDTRTGEIAEIPLPDGYGGGAGFVYDLDVADDLLFARVTPANDLLVYSLTEETWVDTVPDVVGLAVSPAVDTEDSGETRREVLIVPIQGAVVAYDLQTGDRRDTSLNLGGAGARGWAAMELGLPDFPGESLVTATSRAVFHAWNPVTGETISVRADAALSPFAIRSLGSGPNGDVYVGGYASPPGAARVDADTGQTELLSGLSQVEGMVAHGDEMFFGVYPGARVYRYDTTRPWEPGSNPVTDLDEIIHIGHEQDRPVAWASAGDLVAAGTMPDYGELGGALTLIDPATGGYDVYRHVVEDQTVLALAYRDGIVYGGTGIWGGIGVDPTTSEGRLFAFDVETREVASIIVPVPGAQNVSALTFDDEGTLWGLTAGDVFAVDVESGEVIMRESVFDVDDSNIYATGRELFWHDGILVGQSAGRLFEIDPDTLEATFIQTGVQNLAIDRHGSYYYNRGSRLFRWIPEREPMCDVVITGEREGTVAVTGGTTCVRDAEVRGSVTVAPDAGLVVEDSRVTGSVSTTDASHVVIRRAQISGSVRVEGTAGVFALSGSTISGSLACTGNDDAPDDEGVPNTVTGSASGQCADL